MTASASSSKHDVADLSLADEGDRLIDWAAREMPVLTLIRERFEKERPLAGLRLGACLHVTSETANLAITLRAGGADVRLCASNPLSTQDPVAAALTAHHGVPTFAVRGEDSARYFDHINAVLDHRPQLTMDDGADLVAELHKSRTELIPEVLAGTEETTTGVIRLRAMAADGALRFPIVAVNEALTKHLFDNRYGTGQSTLDGLIRATNVLLAGKTLVVCGYGWCGRGLASRAAGHGAHVVVTEVDPVRALEAAMDGYRVMTLAEAAPGADFIITVTGDINVVDRRHFELLKDGCIVANSGHFNDELNLAALDDMATGVSRPRPPRRVLPARRRPHRQRARPGAAAQPRRRRGPPRRGDGHVLRQPGALCRTRRPPPRGDGAARLRRADRDRPGDRRPQAAQHGDRDRRAHPGAAPLPGLLGIGHILKVRATFR